MEIDPDDEKMNIFFLLNLIIIISTTCMHCKHAFFLWGGYKKNHSLRCKCVIMTRYHSLCSYV
ncbi:hypothetical protein BLA29_013646 [Euroglyphus maynei]|uniref:Uncharacterized protein n=1 Tax=Euroglyphus maynei TaxID=6958 RepID=A0A1Y3AQG0_EURMA|nr:hypothetical protein BLA29_013646 [Euroglyphus maynei]